MRIPLRRVGNTADLPLPRYMSDGAAGMDLYAAVLREEQLLPGERKMIPTGISVALPRGCEAQIRPRSGLAVNHGVTLLNSPGTIDADYRGEICLIMINLGNEPFLVRRGDRVAQMVVQQVVRAVWTEETELDTTARGDGGFGHTGL
ncbi:MAG: dUTP diphosphatase [Syntrophales bacterium]|nr:dUTP diphosphatase [Syntrophales bacterium]MCK9527513.1 dUTP diphosphatase [Syntrophales bacterium]MDX9922570.1 dUTP diphosphatase [Syntrophales bacterium]